MKIIDKFEQSEILYYADYLSLKETFTPVTDNCKYYIVFEKPLNSAFICDLSPFYASDDKFYLQAKKELSELKKQVGQEGVDSFLKNLCNIYSSGVINGLQMLNCILYYEDKKVKKLARKTYQEHLDNIKYTITYEEDGEERTVECTKYIAHQAQQNERILRQQGVHEGSVEDTRTTEDNNTITE